MRNEHSVFAEGGAMAYVVLRRAAAVLLACAALGAAAQDANERVALVIGNSAYQSVPLPNPVNDARAMTTLLKDAGFQVDSHYDASQQQLLQAVEKFGRSVRDPKVKFGLFYYAGHGLQLDWRNYLVPVNARIKTPADVQKQAVDVSELMKTIAQARGRSFLVILDACRDDPFGDAFRPPLKGLSQFDAPVGSMLAYATAPGSIAMDGAGQNSLYTANLLREFAIKGTRVEDAFKRVRLNVRLASRGRQVPWESTSLEEDVYLFPSDRRKLSEAEQDALLEQEIRQWQQVRVTNDHLVLAEFIRQYPSGSASELAHARLNRLLAAQADLERRRVEMARAQATSPDAPGPTAVVVAVADTGRSDIVRSTTEPAAAAPAPAPAPAVVAAAPPPAAPVVAAPAPAPVAVAAAPAPAPAPVSVPVAAVAAPAPPMIVKATPPAPQPVVAAAPPPPATPSPVAAGAVQVASLGELPPMELAQTPFSKGYSEHHREYKVGDVHRFRVVDGLTKADKPLILRVTKVDVDNDRVEFNGGEFASDLMGNTIATARGSFVTPRQFYPAELYVGKRWQTRFKQNRVSGLVYTYQYDVKVVGRETITVPAGTFEAFKIEARGFNIELSATLSRNIWVVPGIPADIAHETIVRLNSGRIEQFDRQELVSLGR
jgi:uncharacterized caspase-like protein